MIVANPWDKKAKFYDKNGGKLTKFQLDFLELIKSWGVDFSGKSLIDIGCGTGNYTLYLAKECKQILGIDSSKGMLDELEKKRKNLKLTNVSTKCVSFKEFVIGDKFDIVFLTMSPAVSPSEFDKFINLAPLRVYLNWEKERYSSVLSPLFTKLGKEKKISDAFLLTKHLEDKNLNFKTKILEEKRIEKRDFDKALDNAKWHLNISGLKISDDSLIKYLKNLETNGVVSDEIVSTLRVIVF